MMVQIPFQQLLRAVKSLTKAERSRLSLELVKETQTKDDKSEYLDMLLNGPIYSEEDIDTIEENRKSIKQWRTKS